MSGGIQGGNASVGGGEDMATCMKRLKAAEGERDALAGYLKAERTKREAERAGRIRAETALRKALAAAASPSSTDPPVEADPHEGGERGKEKEKEKERERPLREANHETMGKTSMNSSAETPKASP